MKDEEKLKLDVVIRSWNPVDEIERLETPELEERRIDLKKKLEEIVVGLQIGIYDDLSIALFKDNASGLLEENERAIAQRLEPRAIFKPNISNKYLVDNAETRKRRDVPLLRVHNTLIHDGRIDRPVITYYRVNGEIGRLEESFKIIGNKQSSLGGGAHYEA
jgi:hypothetical protein